MIWLFHFSDCKGIRISSFFFYKQAYAALLGLAKFQLLIFNEYIQCILFIVMPFGKRNCTAKTFVWKTGISWISLNSGIVHRWWIARRTSTKQQQSNIGWKGKFNKFPGSLPILFRFLICFFYQIVFYSWCAATKTPYSQTKYFWKIKTWILTESFETFSARLFLLSHP